MKPPIAEFTYHDSDERPICTYEKEAERWVESFGCPVLMLRGRGRLCIERLQVDGSARWVHGHADVRCVEQVKPLLNGGPEPTDEAVVLFSVLSLTDEAIDRRRDHLSQLDEFSVSSRL